jgi:hypothetical protein
MLNCREATRLISQSMDAKLSWHRRLALKAHLLCCTWCRRYDRQLQFLRQAAGELRGEGIAAQPQKLSGEEKERLCGYLRDRLKNRPPSE